MTVATDLPTGERGPGPGWRDRMGSARVFARRQRLTAFTTVAVAALLAGVIVGRLTAPPADGDTGRLLQTTVVPLALDADGIWTSAPDGGASVSEALLALRRDGDASQVVANAERWLASYDTAIVRLAGVDLPADARAVQRQFLIAVTLSRDAVEVLVHAAEVTDDTARHDLTVEVGRLRMRSEQLTQMARASVGDLSGGRSSVGRLPELPVLDGGRTG